MQPKAILETVVYATDLDAAERFYRDVLGLQLYSRVAGRQVFFRCGAQMLLIFNPLATVEPPKTGARVPVPPHGALGPGHVCFAATADELDAWRRRLQATGIELEADFEWPSPDPAKRGRSIYFRDPAGNSIEFAQSRIWGIPADPDSHPGEYDNVAAQNTGLKLVKGTRIVVASHNAGKVREIDDLIAPYGLNAVSAGALGLPEPEETELTFVGNAKLKALAAAKASGLPALSDDSGLEVEALDGAPGIYSARWAGPSKDFAEAMRKVSDELEKRGAWKAAAAAKAPGPRANFTCALCLAWPDGGSETFEGKVFGHLVWPPRGANGFGYDAMFVPESGKHTFGEMNPADKHAMSHRARAFDLFKSKLAAS